MTKRYQHILTLVELRENIRQFPTLADQHIYNTILESLPPAHSHLYCWIGAIFGKHVTTAMVMDEWGYTSGYASLLLNELWQFGLLHREKDKDSNQFFYNIVG